MGFLSAPQVFSQFTFLFPLYLNFLAHFPFLMAFPPFIFCPLLSFVPFYLLSSFSFSTSKLFFTASKERPISLRHMETYGLFLLPSSSLPVSTEHVQSQDILIFFLFTFTLILPLRSHPLLYFSLLMRTPPCRPGREE